MPSSLRAAARWQEFAGPDGPIPVMLVHPDWTAAQPAPIVLWLHGRTAHKELDPGRYLRWMRAGIGACAIDLPGHGQRLDASLEEPSRTLDVVRQAINEIDSIVEALREFAEFDLNCMGIGGMSAGGMATLARLCRAHPFACASVEATTGSWRHQRERQMFQNQSQHKIDEFNPIKHLDDWREIPLQAIHAVHDEWVSIDGQREFIESLRRRYANPKSVECVEYDKTGAPGEHIGFGKFASEAKDMQRDFFRRWLLKP